MEKLKSPKHSPQRPHKSSDLFRPTAVADDRLWVRSMISLAFWIMSSPILCEALWMDCALDKNPLFFYTIVTLLLAFAAVVQLVYLRVAVDPSLVWKGIVATWVALLIRNAALPVTWYTSNYVTPPLSLAVLLLWHVSCQFVKDKWNPTGILATQWKVLQPLLCSEPTGVGCRPDSGDAQHLVAECCHTLLVHAAVFTLRVVGVCYSRGGTTSSAKCTGLDSSSLGTIALGCVMLASYRLYCISPLYWEARGGLTEKAGYRTPAKVGKETEELCAPIDNMAKADSMASQAAATSRTADEQSINTKLSTTATDTKPQSRRASPMPSNENITQLETARGTDASPKRLIRYELKKLIASGARGSVHLAISTDVGSEKEIAVKTVHLELGLETRLRQVRRLDQKLADVLHFSHPNLVRHIQTQFRDDGGPIEIPEYTILMEYCHGGTLHDAAQFSTSPYYIQKWIKEALLGLEYLHDRKIVHRDIKAPSLLLTSRNLDEGHVKIADLGDAHRLLRDVSHSTEGSYGKGSFAFMSPEMVMSEVLTSAKKAIYIGRRTDIWSIGCVVIELLTGAMPKYIKRAPDGNETVLKSEMAVLNYVGGGGVPEIPSDIPQAMTDFIVACIKRDPTERPIAVELLRHPFLQATDIEKWSYPDPRPDPPTAPQDGDFKSYWSSRSVSNLQTALTK